MHGSSVIVTYTVLLPAEDGEGWYEDINTLDGNCCTTSSSIEYSFRAGEQQMSPVFLLSELSPS